MHRSHGATAARPAVLDLLRALLGLALASASRSDAISSDDALPTLVVRPPDHLPTTLKPMTLNVNAGKFFDQDEVNISRGETTLAKVAPRYKELGVKYLRLHDYDAEHGHPL